ncbi:DUF2799 domain-containing protein [Pelagibacterium limicola]|uniref:DUF2799 domain-containing protein n=1 Tax=Pelagibacterium limicola TaxID=2791022 RepID=UPI0018AF7B37|nr:DUF2799 domain-containing protein [Pelagibacterium limicola]
MLRLALIGAAFLAAAIIASCATLSKAECSAGDWRSVGIGDGANGYPASYVDNHISACAQHGIVLDRQLYEAGRQEGLRTYCRLERAEREGRAGRASYNTCQGEIGVSFARVHTAARALFDLNARITSLDSEIETAIANVAKPDLTPEQRSAMRTQLQSLQNTRLVLERERSARESELASIRRSEELRLSQANIPF